MSDDNDMDVPPLEDMSSVLENILSWRDLKTDGSSPGEKLAQTGVPPTGTTTLSSNHSAVAGDSLSSSTGNGENSSGSLKQSPPKSSHPSSGSGGFGGMKKGFLFGGQIMKPSTSGSSSIVAVSPGQQTETDNIPFITAKKDSLEDKNRFEEVQQAMKVNDTFAMNKEWLTEDLLKRIQSNGDLCQRLQDPTFMQAIGEFQANPQAAMRKYGDNAVMQAFFRDFCGLLGDHFSSLGDQQVTTDASKVHVHPSEGAADITVADSCRQTQKAAGDDAEDERVKEILADGRMREILIDSKIQQLMALLRNDPVKAQTFLQTADNELRAKINCLVGAGLLQFQS